MRTLSTVNAARVGDTVTQPAWLVSLGFGTPLRISSRGAITLGGTLYAARGLDVNIASMELRIFNDTNFSLSSTFLAGTAGVACLIYKYYGTSTTPALADADLFYEGELGACSIGEWIRVQLRIAPARMVPRLFATPPTCNFLPPEGVKLITVNGTYVLSRGQ